MALALLLHLFDNFLKHAQFNTVFVQQEEMDRVGFEPMTLARNFPDLKKRRGKKKIFLLLHSTTGTGTLLGSSLPFQRSHILHHQDQ
jgi:hypothetical protein